MTRDLSKQRRRRLFRYDPMSRWTPAIALRRMACRIEDAKAALADVASIWGDVDQGAVEEADRLGAELDEFLRGQREMIRERLEAGEHVGP